MALYKFTLPAGAKTLKYNGVTDAFVQAGSEAAALVLLKAVDTTDHNVVWDNATATVIGQDLEGITFNVVVDAPALDVSYTGISGDEWTDVGVALAALLVEAGVHAVWAVNGTHGTLYGTLIVANGDTAAAAETATMVAQGTGYTANDVLTVADGAGTSATETTITVLTVDAGKVATYEITEAGSYSVFPANPVGVTGGTGGDDFTANMTWDAEQPGAGTLEVTVVDAAANDVAAASVGNIVHEGAATADLSVDILSTVPSTQVIGLFIG